MTLRIQEVSKSFGTTEVLRNISLDIAVGSRMALVGASGSGKSTLLRLIAGFERPDRGSIALGGRTLSSERCFVAAHRRGVGYVPQDGALFPHLTVAGNIGFGMRRGSRRRRVSELMDLASLDSDLADRLPHQLSGGQQQRVALARALAAEPKMILLDEPFSALDTGLRRQTREAVVEVLERSGVTTVLVTHDQEEAVCFGDGLGVIVQGRLVQAGAPDDVYDAPLTADVARFLGDVVFIDGLRDGTDHVATRIGRLRVRHDRSSGSQRAVAMLRPDQLRLYADVAHPEAEGGCPVTVVEVRRRGVSAEIVVRLGDGNAPSSTASPAQITHRVPIRESHRFVPGRTAAVRVQGAAVLYPTSAGSAAAAAPSPTGLVSHE